MSALTDLEKNLNDVFTNRVPALPEGAKKWIVEWAPWLSLVGGVFALWSAYALWHWARVTNDLTNYLNEFAATYGVQTVDERLTLMVWVSLAVLAFEGLLYILAFTHLKNRSKMGWNILFYTALLNVVYGLVVLFTDYGGVGSFVGSLIGSAIGMYFLFQIRSFYKVKSVSAHPQVPSTPAHT